MTVADDDARLGDIVTVVAVTRYVVCAVSTGDRFASVAMRVSGTSPADGEASGVNGADAPPVPSGSRFTIGWPSTVASTVDAARKPPTVTVPSSPAR